MKTWALSLSLLLLSGSLTISYGYLPVIVLHGIFSDSDHMNNMVSMVTNAHPGTQIYNIDGFDNLESLMNMWEQVDWFKKQMLPIFKNSTDGVHMVCYSQGGLACRAILETTPNHNVKSFISLSSPQAGQFGVTEYLRLLFPNFTRHHMHLVFYTHEGQEISIGNYWRDPNHMQEYMKNNVFLPKLDYPTDPSYRTNFMAIEKLVLIGGPDDGVITPWQSSLFGFYDENITVMDMDAQKYYIKDTFGLKALNDAGKIHVYSKPNVHHAQWHGNKQVFEEFIQPYLT